MLFNVVFQFIYVPKYVCLFQKKAEPLPSTPNRLKKIEVGTKFNFDQSLDVESSLSDSTQSMAIQDFHTPKQVPPHYQEKVVRSVSHFVH